MRAGIPLCAADASPEVAACTIVRVTTANAASTTAMVTPEIPHSFFLMPRTDDITFRDVHTDILTSDTDLYLTVLAIVRIACGR